MKASLSREWRRQRRSRIAALESLEGRTLLTAAMDVNAGTHALTYVAQTGFSNAITVELTSAATPTLRISEGNSENISMSTAAQDAGWHYPDISNVHVVEGPAASVSSMAFDTKDGSDQVFLLSAGVPVTVGSSAAATLAVEVGSANGDPGLSQNVAGPVVIGNTGGTSSVFVNDFAEAVARTVSVTDTAISGLTPNPVSYDSSVNVIQVRTASAANTVTVTNTTGAKTITIESHGNDTVNVTATATGSFLGLGGINGGHASVNVTDAGSTQGIHGAVTFDTTNEFTNVLIDDSADATARTIFVHADGKITGIAPATIDLQSVEVKNLTIKGGGGGNSFVWANTAMTINDAPANATLMGGAGDDTFAVPGTLLNSTLAIVGGGGADGVFLGRTPSNNGRALDVVGPVDVSNAGGTLDITVSDDGTFFRHTIEVTGTGESGLTSAPVTWHSPSSVSLVGGIGNSMFNDLAGESWTVRPSAVTTFNIDGGLIATQPGYKDDTLYVDPTGLTSPSVTVSTSPTALQHGTYTFGNAMPLNFTRIGTLLGAVFGKVSNGLNAVPIANALVFLDANANGTPDAGEDSTTTDAGGAFLFKVPAGSYRVAHVLPAGLTSASATPLIATVSEGLPAPALIVSDVPPPVAGGPDLVVAFAGGLPASVIGGSAGKVKVTVTNNSDTATASGAALVKLFASGGQHLEAGDTEITPTISLGKLKLKPHASKTVNAKFTFPATLPDGDFYILASVDPTNVIGESDETNNLAVSASTVHITAPFVDLSGTLAGGGSIKAGKPVVVPVVIKNTGNVTAKGTIAVDFYASTDATFDAATDTLLKGQVPVKINIKPAKSQTVRVRFTPTTTPAAGKYSLVAVLNSTQSLAEPNFADDVLVGAAQVTVV